MVLWRIVYNQTFSLEIVFFLIADKKNKYKKDGRVFGGGGQKVRRGQFCYTSTLHSGHPEFKPIITNRLP